MLHTGCGYDKKNLMSKYMKQITDVAACLNLGHIKITTSFGLN